MPGKLGLADNSGSQSGASACPYRIFCTDDVGNLSVSLPTEEARVLLKVQSSSSNAVQKLARGSLRGSTGVLALARHSGQIDVVSIDEGKPLLSIQMPHFKKGIHRWAGLAIAEDGIFACSSAGVFTFSPLEVAPSGSIIAQEDVVSLDLPEPLQDVQFEPLYNPRTVAFGGESVPLSVWDVRKMISSTKAGTSAETSQSIVQEGQEKEELHGKARKRRRMKESRAKGKDLQPGEIWRAKNLPNTPIGLVNKPSIVSIIFLEEDKIAIGTRHGSLQLYHVGPQRRPIREISLFGNDNSPIKLLSRSYIKGQLVTADNLGRVCIVDYQIGKILYKYESFASSALSLCPLPPLVGERSAYLVTSSAEKLIRVHSMPLINDSKNKSKVNGKILSTIFNPGGTRHLMWDGAIPDISQEIQQAAGEGNAVNEEGVTDSNDDIWQDMAIIGNDEIADEHRSQRRRL